MKISCIKENLLLGLACTSHIGTRQVNLPILNNVLFRADGKTIRLVSTNLEIAVVVTTRGKIEEVGEYTVPSKLFFDYTNLLPNERVDIALEDDALRVSCGQHETKMKGAASTEFPLIPPISGGRSFELSVEEFRAALSQVLFAVSGSESRPELSGAVFKFHSQGGKNTLVIAATDSYRLSERILSLDAGIETGPAEAIIPARTLFELGRIIGLLRMQAEAPDRLEILLSEAQVVFRCGPVELLSRTIEGNYPDYQPIIPKSFRTEAVVRKEELVLRVKSASLFSRTGLFDVSLAFDPVAGDITVSATDAARGEHSAHTAAQVKGEANHVTLNSRYLLDGLNAIQTEELVFGMNDPASPCILRPKEDPVTFLYLVMPIKQ